MKIVIDIPEDVKKAFDEATKDDLYGCYYDANSVVGKAIKNGTPLPKGYGALVDKSKICKAIYAEEDSCTGMGMTLEEMDAYNDGIDAMYNLVRGAKPIIEADEEGVSYARQEKFYLDEIEEDEEEDFADSINMFLQNPQKYGLHLDVKRLINNLKEGLTFFTLYVIITSEGKERR